METDEFLRWLETDGERLAAAIEHGPLDAPVTACPGWTLGDLGAHVGGVHRWAATAARTAAPPEGGLEAPDGPLAGWYRAGLDELREVLRGLDDRAPTWHPFPAPREAGVWKRRQAHEVAVHRYDAQVAAGLVPDPIDPSLASDGVDEYFGMIVPRVVTREKVETPRASLHIHCTDVPGEWLVWTDDGGYQFRREHAKGDAALRGPAADLLLFVHRRIEFTDEMQIIGDDDTVTAWRSMPGL